MKRPFYQLARFVLLSLGAVVFIIPLVWMVATALKPIDQTMSMPPRWVPVAWTTTLAGAPVEVGVGVVPPDAGPDTPVPASAAYQWSVMRDGTGELDRVPVKLRSSADADPVTVEINHRWEWVRAGEHNPVRLVERGPADPPQAAGTVPVNVIDRDGAMRRQVVPEAELVRVWGTTRDEVNQSYSVSETITVPRDDLSRNYVPWNGRGDRAYVETESLSLRYSDVKESTDVQWGNFGAAVREMGDFGRYLGNTLTLCVLTVLGTVLSCSIVAYGFSRIDWPGRDKVFLVVLGTMMIPFPVIMVPLYGLFKDLGWIGTLKPLWVPTFFATAFNVFLLRQFFMTIPKELSEAARIDGCSEFRIFWGIILPLAKPALTVVALFQFLATWNDFLGPLIYLTDQKDYTLALGLQFFQSQAGGTQWHYLMAASTLVVAPVIVLFFLAQRVFIEGVSMSGLKG